jgi:hypothetical protein
MLPKAWCDSGLVESFEQQVGAQSSSMVLVSDKDDIPAFRIDLDSRFRRKLAAEQLFRQRVLDRLLDRAFEGACAVDRVEAFFAEEFECGVAHFEFAIEFGEMRSKLAAKVRRRDDPIRSRCSYTEVTLY